MAVIINNTLLFVLFIIGAISYTTPANVGRIDHHRHLPVTTSSCVIDVNKDINASSPLILDKRTLDIVYPDKTNPKTLTFKAGQEQLMHCPGGDISTLTTKATAIKSLRDDNYNSNSSESAVCVRGTTFSKDIKSQMYSLDQVVCSKPPNPVVKEDNARKCANGVVADIGYQLTERVFKRTIDLCHSRDAATTRWSHARIPGAIGGSRSSDFHAPNFGKASFFKNVLMAQVYPQNHQRRTFAEIFEGNKSLVERYLPSEGKRNFLVKGHLVARADMFYYPEQYSTYFYVNVLPMWQSINNGNWKSVESSVRRMAATDGDVDVWTGGLDVLKLADREIHLARDRKESSKRLVPVPKLLFKLVHNREKNEALAFVTANDPYLEEGSVPPAHYTICKPYKLCEEKFPNFDKTYEGYTYCCEPRDFFKSSKVKALRIPIDLTNAKVATLR